MGILTSGDEDLHYSDSSHRWIAPPETSQQLWEAGLRAHIARHLSNMGGSQQDEPPGLGQPYSAAGRQERRYGPRGQQRAGKRRNQR